MKPRNASGRDRIDADTPAGETPLPDDAPRARRSPLRVALDRAEARMRRWLTVMLCVFAAGVAVLLVIAHVLGAGLPPGAAVAGGSAISLALAAAFAAARANHASFPLWVSFLASHWIFFSLYLHTRAPRAWPIPVETAVGFALLWASAIAPPWVVAVSGAVLALASPLLGLPWAVGTQTGVALDAYEVLSFTILAFFVSLRLAGYERYVKGPIERAVSGLERRREALAHRLVRREQDIEQTVEHLLDAKKLDLERAMSRQLAHQLNNALTPLRGTAELLLRTDDPERRRQYAQRILRASQVAAKLAESLLAYTRQGLFSPVYTDLGRFVEREVLPEIVRGLSAGVRVECEAEKGLYVRIDRSLARHMVEQLVVNAVHASGERGTVHVLVRRAEATSAQQAMLIVRDEGTGMPPEVAERAFEPFFTTKGPGEGRGLGLAMVEGITARHQGTVSLRSAPERGTTVTVHLPLAQESSDAAPWQIEPSVRPHLLLLSNDPDVRDVVTDIAGGLPLDCVAVSDLATLETRLAVLPAAAVVVDRLHDQAAAAVALARREGVPVVSTDAETRRSGGLDTGLGVPHVPLDPVHFARILGDFLDRGMPGAVPCADSVE